MECDRKIIGLRTFALLQLQLDFILIKETEFTPIHLEKWRHGKKNRDNEKEECKKGEEMLGSLGFGYDMYKN